MRLLRAAWLFLLVAVLGLAGYLGWMLVVTNKQAVNNARHATADFVAACTAGAGVDAGQPQVLGLLSFPGQSSTEWPIMAGTSSRDLATGVGWYPQTAGAGEIGNMVLAGHRLTHGAPFGDLLDLAVGDQVRITTCTDVFTYVIEVAPRDLTVQVHDDWVLDAVPGEPGRQPTGRMITLVTSQDLLPTSDRSVGMGVLASAEPR